MIGYDYRERYWRIREYDRKTKTELQNDLLERESYFDNGETIHQLRKRLFRVDRGLLIYERCTADELRRFTHDRHIEVVNAQDKAAMIESLEEADSCAKFQYFEALPPELRVLICKMQFEAFDIGLSEPSQPPISCVSRLLRQEALSLFYETCTFNVELDCSRKLFGGNLAAIYTSTRKYLDRLSDDEISHIKRLKIKLHVRRVAFAHLTTPASECYVLIPTHDGINKPSVRINQLGERSDKQSRSTWLALSAKRLEKLLNGISARADRNKLKRRDFDAIAEVFQSDDD